MKTLSLFVFFSFQCCFSFNSHAQTGEIQGKVTDAETGETLPFVNVLIEGNGNLSGTSTDFDGIYSLNNIQPGFYTITFSYVAYQTEQIKKIQAEIDKTTFLNIKLSYDSEKIQPLVIDDPVPSLHHHKENNYVTVEGIQAGEIQGKVTDAETGETLPFVNVSIEVEGRLVGTITDFDGIYSLVSIPEGIYSLTFSYLGYKKMVVEEVLVVKNEIKRIHSKLIIDYSTCEDTQYYNSYYPSLFNSQETRLGITISRTANGHFYYSNIR